MRSHSATPRPQLHARASQHTCPFCKGELSGRTWVCSGCHTAHHEECARENERCTSLGCGRLFEAPVRPLTVVGVARRATDDDYVDSVIRPRRVPAGEIVLVITVLTFAAIVASWTFMPGLLPDAIGPVTTLFMIAIFVEVTVLSPPYARSR